MKNLLITTMLSATLTAATLATPTTYLAGPAPAAVKATITRLYPTVKTVKYDKEGGDFEAGFTHNGKAMSVVLNAAGVVKETETAITVVELPTAVRTYLAKQMPGKKIKEAAEIVDANGVKKYEAEVGGKDYIFDSAGNLLR